MLRGRDALVVAALALSLVAALEAVLTGTTLNLGHGSALLLPHADWSLSDSMRLVFGGAFGIGAGVRGDGSPGSEYDGAPPATDGAIKIYF